MNELAFLVNFPIFQNLTLAEVQSLSSILKPVDLPKGRTLFQPGDAGEDACYLLVSGTLRLFLCQPNGVENCLGQLSVGDWVGEIALLSGQQHLTAAIAHEDCQLLYLPTSALDRLAGISPEPVREITRRLILQYQRIQAGIILTNLFGQLTDETLQDLLEKIQWRRLYRGEELFHQADPGDALYIVVQGRLRFWVTEVNGSTRTLGEVGAGETIGEFALLAESGTPESQRSATVYATRLTDVISFSRPVFESLMCQYPQAILKITRRIIHRQRLIDQSVILHSSALVICVVPTRPDLGSHSPQSSFARQLVEALNHYGCSLLFDPARFEEWYGKPGASRTPLDHPTSLMINAWLDEQECHQQFVVFDTSPDVFENGCLSAWAQRCVEDADIILLVGEAGESAVPGAVEACIGSNHRRARVELVLLHASDQQVPQGTAAWISPQRGGMGPFQAHYHVRLNHEADVRRAARRIIGKPVGLALGGGGARGWAHVGVLKAFEEAGIELDWIGGASMGSIIAAGCALDWSADQLTEMAVRFSDPKKLLDYTFPYASITATQNITRLLRQVYGDVDIEDTWRPFYSISSNLSKGEEQVHFSGKLWKAVRASMAFPTIFAPVLDGGCVLIDGGAANNVPVDRLREQCPSGTVIGVNLEEGSPMNKPYQFGDSLSGWHALVSRMVPSSHQITAPNLLDIVAGIIYSNNRYRMNETRNRADLIINVDTAGLGLLDFDKYEQIIELGYLCAKEQIKNLPKQVGS
jgi:lysophospholipid hydrolase